MKRHLPSLNALAAFEAAGRLGRMIDAAGELNVTHSAVSRQVKALEERLGLKLFEGPRNRPALTQAGRTLLPELTESLDRIERAVRAVADDAAGPLDISVLGTFTLRWLIPRLHGFQSAHPAIELRLSASDRPVDFARASFEVAIRVGAGPWPEDALVSKLFDEQVGPVCAPRLRRGLKKPGDLAAVPKLHTQTRLGAWSDWARRVDWAEPRLKGQRFEHFYLMLEAAVAGLGVAVAPRQLVADDLAAGRLVAPFGFVPSGQAYVALRRKRRSRKAATFVDWLVAEAGATPR